MSFCQPDLLSPFIRDKRLYFGTLLYKMCSWQCISIHASLVLFLTIWLAGVSQRQNIAKGTTRPWWVPSFRDSISNKDVQWLDSGLIKMMKQVGNSNEWVKSFEHSWSKLETLEVLIRVQSHSPEAQRLLIIILVISSHHHFWMPRVLLTIIDFETYDESVRCSRTFV